MGRHSPAASGSLPVSWWSATSSARARPRSRRSSATRPTSPRACRQWPSPGTVVIGEAHPAAARRPVRAARARAADLQGYARAGAGSSSCCGERALESRFAARRTGGVAPLVGRDQELALLLERWRQAKGGEGQLVLLTGEAGIGKSRITEAHDRGRGRRAAFPDPLPMLALPRRLGAASRDPAPRPRGRASTRTTSRSAG